MSETLATAYVQLQPSFRGLQRSLDKEVGGALSKIGDQGGKDAGRKFSTSFSAETSRSLRNFGAKALVGAGLLTAGIMKTAEAAGNLEAALAANEQILGSASSQVQEWAQTSVEAVGLSERAAIEASTTFALFGEKMNLTGADLATFSTDMVELSADLAAFKDISPEQVLQDLSSAFAGSTETMTKYGIFLNETALKQEYLQQTGEAVTGVLTPQQKLLATHAALVEQSGTMTGQWARESDSLAAMQAKAKASAEDAASSIGEAFVPAASKAFELVATGAGGFARLNGATGGAIAEMTLFGAAGLGAAGALSTIAGSVGGAVSKFRGMSSAMKTTTLAAGGITAALTIGYTIWSAYQARQETARERVANATDALVDQTREAWANADAIRAAGKEVDAIVVANGALSNSLVTGATNSDRFVDALGSLGLRTDDAYEALLAIETDAVPALAALAEQAGLSAEMASVLAAAVNDTDSNRLDDLSASFAAMAMNAGYSRDEARSMARTLQEEFGPVATSLEELQDQSEDYAGTVDDLARGYLNQGIAQGQLTAALVEEAEERAGATRESDDAIEVYFALQEIIAAMTEEERSAALGAEGMAAAVGDAGAAADDAVDPINDVAEATDEVETVSASTIRVVDALEAEFGDAGDAAATFSGALGVLVGSNLSLQEAEDRLIQETNDLVAAVTEATEAGDENATSLANSTEAGLANREMVRNLIEASFSSAEAMLESGASVDEAADAVTRHRAELEEQLLQLGFNQEAVTAYLDELGLTPESVATTVEIYNDQVARERVQSVIDRLGEVPAETAAEIQALIDAGAIDEAERRLNHAARDRTTTITTVSRGGGGFRSAWGGYYDSASSTTLVEDGDPEAVLTIGKPLNLRAQLADPRIRLPIEDALAARDSTTLTPRVSDLMDAPQLGADQTIASGPMVTMTGPVTIMDATDIGRVAAAITLRLGLL